MISTLLCFSLLLLHVDKSQGSAERQSVGQNEYETKSKLSSHVELQQDSNSPRLFFVLVDDLEDARLKHNQSAGDVDISLRDFSSDERIEGLTATNDLRRSKGASNMMFTCWENVLASYALYTAGQCNIDAREPSYFDYKTYLADRTVITLYGTQQRKSIEDTIKYFHGYGGVYYKSVTQYDLIAMGCSQVFCNTFISTTSTIPNIYVNSCYFYYRSRWYNTGSPFTPGTACSSCPSGTSCDKNLCRDYTSYLPALDCKELSSSTSSTSSMSSFLLVLMTSCVALLTAMGTVLH